MHLIEQNLSDFELRLALLAEKHANCRRSEHRGQLTSWACAAACATMRGTVKLIGIRRSQRECGEELQIGALCEECRQPVTYSAARQLTFSHYLWLEFFDQICSIAWLTL